MRPWVKQTLALPGLFLWATLFTPTVGWADTIRSEVDLSTKEIASKESAIGDLVADALKAAAKTDAAFVAASSFNDSVSLPKGNVNTGDVADALIYKSENVAIVKLTGEQISKAMEQSLFLFPKSNSAFLQFSGLSITLKSDSEAGKRIATIKLDGEALDMHKTYRVAMPAPLANGGLAYFKVWQKSSIEKETDTTVESALNSYFADHKTISKGDERLVTHK